MKNLSLIFLFALMTFSVTAQTYDAFTLIEKRAYYLNGGARASLGGKSRVTIKIDLPKNTKKWYYSFSTTPGEDGTKLLNLGVQIGAALSTGGLTALAAKSFEIPPGSGSADIIVLPPEFNNAFLNKDDNNWRFYSDISLQNSRQAVQTVENNYGNSFYIGLRNPSSLSGINIVIEVVAVIEEINNETDKGMLYGNLGWKSFERGELDKCVELSKKALAFNPNLCFVKFNIALVHLIQEKEEALDEYVSAIADIKDDTTPKNTLTGAIKDIKDQKIKTPNLKNLKDVEDLLLSEYKKY
jgi:tetratricopeptide (TPR) repeat protein